MPKPAHFLIVAGDPSADRHGATLIQALRKKSPGVKISALGGTFLSRQADKFLFSLVGIGGFGFWEPLLKLPQLYQAFATIKTLLKQDPPDLVIPMDYYGFNIRVARLARAHKVPVAYYISPQVWASRPGRIEELSAVITKMLVIFPFEEDIYRKAGVPVSFVGHPLLEQLPAPGSPASEPTIGLLPGSRRGNIKRHLPILIETAERLRKRLPEIKYILFRPEEIEESFYAPYIKTCPWIELTADKQYEARKKLWLAVSVSGTAALENMLLGIPMIIMYKLSTLTYWIAKRLIQVPFVGIPNLLAGKAVVPELLQARATPEEISTEVFSFLSDARRREDTRRALLSLRETLQEGGSDRAAAEILQVLA
jgi:lipid-A-disaccharide synthase